jgi:hypothetical protein
MAKVRWLETLGLALFEGAGDEQRAASIFSTSPAGIIAFYRCQGALGASPQNHGAAIPAPSPEA